MIGDQNDMVARLQAVLPNRWFPDATPILDGLLAGIGQAASWVYSLIGYAKLQTRIASAGGGWLDLIAQDFFGARLVRMFGQSDAALRARIELELLRPRATRAALIKQIVDVTGRQPVLFEPRRPADTGCWGGYLSYAGPVANGAGGWGSLQLPFQLFVTAYRPVGGGVPTVSGYGAAAGGYGQGAIEYANAAVATGTALNAQIMAAIAGVMPVCGIAWTRIGG